MKLNILVSFCLATAISSSLESAPTDARELTTMRELQEVLASKQPVVIMFYAPWCGACSAMKEPFNKVSAQYKKDAVMVKVNADSDAFKEAVDYFNIEAIPTIITKHVGIMDTEKLTGTVKGLIRQAPLPRPASGKPAQEKPAPGKPSSKPAPGKAAQAKPTSAKPAPGKQAPSKPSTSKPAQSPKTSPKSASTPAKKAINGR